MAETKLHKFSVQEKLNKMDMDMITVTPTISITPIYSNTDVFFAETEIPNAVASKGGSALLQQVNMWDFDGNIDDLIINLHFWQKDPGATLDVPNETFVWTEALVTTYNCLGILTMQAGATLGSDDDDGSDMNFYSVSPVGMIWKADTDSTSIYVTAELIAGTSVQLDAATDIRLQFGVIKD